MISVMSFCFGDHSHGDPADAKQFPGFRGDSDLPNLGTAAHMNGRGPTENESFPNAFDMVGVDFKPHTRLRGRVKVQVGSDTAQGFGQGYGSPAMEQAHGLHRAVVNGHFTSQEIMAHLRQFNAQVLDHGVFTPGVKLLQCNLLFIHSVGVFIKLIKPFNRVINKMVSGKYG
jgi:hypothetical protein